MKRRSTRNARKVSESPLELDENQADLGVNEQPAPVKKARSRKCKTETNGEPGLAKNSRRKRSMLKDLVEMPLDILFEIFGKLDPLDLVHVSRSTKAFRSILMSRSSKSIWQSARMNFEELPDCPDDLTEAQYAVFLFTRYCSFCLRNVTVYISWASRVRTCKKCLDINFRSFERRYDYYHHGKYPIILASWVPLLKISHFGRRRDVWYKFDRLDCQWKEEYEVIISPQAKIEWVNARVKERYAIEQHARKCELWYLKHHSPPDAFYHSHSKLEGKLKVAEFIEELGFGEVLAKINHCVYPHPLDEKYVEEVCKNGLTEAGRAALRDRLVVAFKAFQLNQEIMEYKHIFETRQPLLRDIRKKAIQEYPVGTVFPTIRDIHELAERHGLIDYSKSGTDALSGPFSELYTLWKVPIEDKLIKLMMDAYGQDYTLDQSKALDLATTFFDCTGMHCGNSMRRDSIIGHKCATALPWDDDDLPPREAALQKVFSNSEWKSSARRATIQFGKEEWKTMTRVVQMAGLDPKTATAKEMDELNIIFECLSCNDIDLGRATMTWVAVREHMRSAHMDDYQPPMDLVIVTGRDAKKARKRIYEAQMRKVHSGSCKFLCIYCKDIDTTDFTTRNIRSYRYHLETQHQVTVPPNDSELVFAPDQDLIPPVFRLWPPRGDHSSSQTISPDLTIFGNKS